MDDEAQLRNLLNCRLAALAAPGSNERSVDTGQRASGANSDFFAPLRLPRQRALPCAARRSPRLATTRRAGWTCRRVRAFLHRRRAHSAAACRTVVPRGEQQGGELPQRSSAWCSPAPALPPAERWGGGAPMWLERHMPGMCHSAGHTPSPIRILPQKMQLLGDSVAASAAAVVQPARRPARRHASGTPVCTAQRRGGLTKAVQSATLSDTLPDAESDVLASYVRHHGGSRVIRKVRQDNASCRSKRYRSIRHRPGQ